MINDETPNYSNIVEQLHHVPFWKLTYPLANGIDDVPFPKEGYCMFSFLEGINIVKYDFWNWRAFHETFEKQEMGREVGCFHLLWLLMVQEVVETFMHKQQTTNNNTNAQQPTTTTTTTTNNNNNNSNQNKGEWYNQPTHFSFLGSLFECCLLDGQGFFFRFNMIVGKKIAPGNTSLCNTHPHFPVGPHTGAHTLTVFLW